MFFKISLFSGSLLDIEIDTNREDRPKEPFGFTGGPRCESLDLTDDRDPLND